MTTRVKRPVYAVLRHDAFQGPQAPIEVLVTVTSVVTTRSAARAEVERLTALNREKDCRYYWQATRLVERSEAL